MEENKDEFFEEDQKNVHKNEYKDELELELMELKEKLSSIRNNVDKVHVIQRMNNIKKELADLNSETVEVKAIIQREAPSRIDHVDKPLSGPGAISNSGNRTILANI